jgi:hypothetical protein
MDREQGGYLLLPTIESSNSIASRTLRTVLDALMYLASTNPTSESRIVLMQMHKSKNKEEIRYAINFFIID